MIFRSVHFMVRFIGRIILSPRASAINAWQGLFVWRRALFDRRTPTVAKGLFWFGVAWALMPFDPLQLEQPLGWMVDGVLVVGPIVLAINIVPPADVAEAREVVRRGRDSR